MVGFFQKLVSKLKKKKDVTSPPSDDNGNTVQLNPNTNAYRGRFGEDAAANYLADHGFEIKARNLRYGKHEIDIIAEDRAYLVFV